VFGHSQVTSVDNKLLFSWLRAREASTDGTLATERRCLAVSASSLTTNLAGACPFALASGILPRQALAILDADHKTVFVPPRRYRFVRCDLGFGDVMRAQLDFYFDFSSPYGYLASERVEALAQKHDLDLQWHAIALGFIFPLTGQQPVVNVPLMRDYFLHDVQRCARDNALAYHHPDVFPVGTVAACRTFYWLKQHHPALLIPFTHAVYRAYFTQGEPIASADDVASVAVRAGLQPDGLTQASQDPAVKAATKNAIDDAVARGVFGSPYFLIGDEPFWGNDRIEQIDRYLSEPA
jgi:2-hydroxychromene-2-carboxylate isomerase